MGRPRQRRPTFSAGSNHVGDSSAWSSDADESQASSRSLLHRGRGGKRGSEPRVSGRWPGRPSFDDAEHAPYTDSDGDFAGITVSPTYSAGSSEDSLKSNPSTRRSSVSSGIDDVCMPLDDDTSVSGEDHYSWPDTHVLEEFCKKQREEDVAIQEAEAYRESVNEATEAEQRGRLRPQWHVPWTKDSALDAQNHMRFTYFRDDLYATIHSPTIAGLLGPEQTFQDLFPNVPHAHHHKVHSPAAQGVETEDILPEDQFGGVVGAYPDDARALMGTFAGQEPGQSVETVKTGPQSEVKVPVSTTHPLVPAAPVPPQVIVQIPPPQAGAGDAEKEQDRLVAPTDASAEKPPGSPDDKSAPASSAAQPTLHPTDKSDKLRPGASRSATPGATPAATPAPSIAHHTHSHSQHAQHSQHVHHAGRMYPAISIDPASASKIHSHNIPSHNDERGPWWLDINCPSEEEMRVISRAFGVHPLTTEDILLHETREKIELFHNYYFVCFMSFDVRVCEADDARRGRRDSTGQVSQSSKNSKTLRGRVEKLRPLAVFSIVFHTGIITVHYRPTPHTVNVRRRIRLLRDYLNVTSDWISYALIDDITDGYGPLIESVDEDVQDIEDAILNMHGPGDDDDESVYDEKRSLLSGSSSTGYREWRRKGNMLRWIGESRKRVMSLLSLIGNKADVIKGFSKRVSERWSGAPNSEIAMYLSDIQDHLVTMTQSLNHYEKLLARSHSNYLAQINIDMTRTNNEMNDVLSKISVLGTIVLPINIVTGLWGMNVLVPGQTVHSLTWFYGIVITLLVFAVSAYFMLIRLM